MASLASPRRLSIVMFLILLGLTITYATLAMRNEKEARG